MSYDEQTGAVDAGAALLGELIEVASTQTIRDAVDNVSAHIDAVVEMLDGYAASYPDIGLMFMARDASEQHRYLPTVSQSLSELVRAALVDAITRRIGATS